MDKYTEKWYSAEIAASKKAVADIMSVAEGELTKEAARSAEEHANKAKEYQDELDKILAIRSMVKDVVNEVAVERSAVKVKEPTVDPDTIAESNEEVKRAVNTPDATTTVSPEDEIAQFDEFLDKAKRGVVPEPFEIDFSHMTAMRAARSLSPRQHNRQ